MAGTDGKFLQHQYRYFGAILPAEREITTSRVPANSVTGAFMLGTYKQWVPYGGLTFRYQLRFDDDEAPAEKSE